MDEQKKWDEKTCTTCLSYDPPNLEIVKTTYVKEFVIKVEEIPPIAYIDVFQESIFQNRFSPYKVILSARNTKSGSFPIERIDWDMGDGTPIKIQRRWSINTEDSAFIYTGVYAADWRDPRNFDVSHTYYVKPGGQITFYPSLTCYVSSTAAFDCAKGIVGPINVKPPTTEEENSLTNSLTIIQNELTDKGKVLLGEINCTAVVWTHDK